MEFNKIFAAILTAAIIACIAGFVSKKIVAPHMLHEDAYHIEGVESVGGGTAGPVGPEPIMGLLATADVAKGEKLVRACAACHTFDKGGADGTGPHLWNAMTRGVAATGFAYSAGMKAHGGKWTYAELNHFLWKPKSVVPDTKMNFIGIKKPEDRAAVIAYLRTLNDSQPGLPGQGEIDAEMAELGPKEVPAAEGEEAAAAVGAPPAH
jgi:cytochrome c